MPANQPTKIAVLVDSEDRELGTMEMVAAHRSPGFLHRASSVFLLRQTEAGVLELLMQQRSSEKFTCPLWWGNTCCGNVFPGESYEDCAERRLRQELGITGVKLNRVETFEYRAACNDGFVEHEMDTIFWAWYDGQVQPNSAEVAQYAWVPVADLVAELESGQVTRHYVPWLPIIVNERLVFDRIQAGLA